MVVFDENLNELDPEKEKIVKDEKVVTEDDLSTIELAPLDCAMVFRDSDGHAYPELFLPHYDSPEENVSGAATLCSIIAMRAGDPEFIEECYAWMDAKIGEINKQIMEAEGNDEGRIDGEVEGDSA